MNYRNFPKVPAECLSALGFGFMRLPVTDGEIDVEATRTLLKKAVELGVNYFDTAWPYHGGKSEVVLGRLLKEENLRDRVYIADKLPLWSIKSREDFDTILAQQLERLQTDHIDYYLMHGINGGNWKNVKELGVYDFIKSALASGKVRHIGFSFHDSIEVFKTIIDEYDGWEFCQVQVNYLDDDGMANKSNPGFQALEYAAAHNVGVVVMEPLRGGMLANPPAPVAELFVPEKPAAMGFAAVLSRPEVAVVLSGMNTVEQLEENSDSASRFTPGNLTAAQSAALSNAKAWFDARIKVPCTACRYCMPCPAGVDIPGVFNAWNRKSLEGAFEGGVTHARHDFYANHVVAHGNGADKCVECGACEEKCPQHIEIRAKLKEAHAAIV